ncbi:hypothetical protein N0V90_013147 [Kalmusia sp. IMI 367209]|nr:hypothetical protein N0V90_013147 [Kalmusia sp. IMI 367209]
MSDPKEELIQIPIQAPSSGTAQAKHTLPVEEHRRLKDEEIRIELCTVEDVDKVAEGLYTIFPAAFWDKMEPLDIRNGNLATRQKRLATRLAPSFDMPAMKWIKAIYAPTGQTVGIAGWMLPATAFFGWKEKMNWTDADIEEMWRGVSLEAWEGQVGGNDTIREQVMGEEPHWFLAPLMTWPDFQGRGIATKLMMWAIEQADKADPVQPMYLESAPTARNVYMRFGFMPQGEANFLRRGPDVLAGLEGVEGKLEKVDIEAVEKNTEAELAS